jgi:TfoX/Sxy family transcriptional regulator of competence genes
MAYDEQLAERARAALKGTKGLAERKMFGGLCFTVNGNMVAGVVDKKLMLRVGPENHEAVLKLKHAQPMDFTGKPMKGMVYVAPEGCKTPAAVKTWLKRALAFAKTLPAK